MNISPSTIDTHRNNISTKIGLDKMRTILILIVIFISTPSLAQDEQPIKILKESVHKTINILKDPRYHGIAQRKVLQQKLEEIARQVFDFTKFSMLTLGSSRNNFNAQQREEFTDVFSRFLAKYYIGRLQEKYSDEKVIFLSQDIFNDSRALIKSNVLWHGLKIPVDIWMLKRNGTWKAYDVVVSGVSAVWNYRAQFDELLMKKSPAKIIELVKSRMDQEGEKDRKNVPTR